MSQVRLLFKFTTIVLFTMIPVFNANALNSANADSRRAMELKFHQMMKEVEAMDHSSPQYHEKKRMIESLGQMMGFRLDSDTGNRAPEAYASYSKSVLTGSNVGVSGFASHDWDDDPLSYQWSFTRKPQKSQVRFLDAAVMAPTFIPDFPGAYEIQLVVSDGKTISEPHSITIIATNGHDGLPKDPGEVGKQTLAGVDADNDGIRDDIKRHIYATYPEDDQRNLRFFLGEIAYNFTNAIQYASNPELAYAYDHRNDQYLHCLNLEAGDESERINKTLSAELMDTKERFLAWNDFQRKAYEYLPMMELEEINDDFCRKVQSGSPLPDMVAVVAAGRDKWEAAYNPQLHILSGEQVLQPLVIPPPALIQ